MQVPKIEMPVYEVDNIVSDLMENLVETDPEVAKLQENLDKSYLLKSEIEKKMKKAKFESLSAGASYQNWLSNLSKIASEEELFLGNLRKTEKILTDLEKELKEAYLKCDKASSEWFSLQDSVKKDYMKKTFGNWEIVPGKRLPKGKKSHDVYRSVV